MLRREVVKLGGSLFGLGAGTPSRFPYAGRPQPSPGVSASSGNVVRARQVIIFGPNGGLFIYSGTPAPGNLTESLGIVSAGFDPSHQNAVLPGDTRYHNNGSVYVAQQSTQSYVAYLWQAASPLGPYVKANTYISFTAEFGTTPNIQLGAALTSVVGVAPGGGTTQAVTLVPPTGDATGAGDLANITTALALGAVQLLPGTYYLSAPLTVGGGYLDMGAATVQPGSAWAAPAPPPPPSMIILGSGCTLKGGTLYGGTNNRNLNPATDAISLTAGATQVRIENVTCNYMNGFILNSTVTASAHCTVKGLIGTNNAGGINITAAAGISAQYNVSDVNVQRCETSEALFLTNVFDVLVSQFNASVLGSAGVPTVHLAGQVTTCKLGQMDCGVIGAATAGVPVLLIEDSGGHSITDCGFSDSTYQAGGIGIAVNGGAARNQFGRVSARNNAGDGWQFNGTGTALAVSDCVGNGNAGTADVNVTSTAHVGLSQFAYCSTTTTDSLSVVAGNHVLNSNPTSPGGKAVSGVPAGW